MHPTPKLIKETDLPLEFVGYEKETNLNVYILSGMRNVDINLSMKSYGYSCKDAILTSGDLIENAWVK